MRFIRFSPLLFLLISNSVFAEGRCPDGYFPIGGGDAGWEGCAPMGPVEDEDMSPPSANLPIEYLPQWGSIARGKQGAWGAVSNLSSERAAEDAALRQCEQSAPVTSPACGIVLSYYNQCVVFVWGSGKGEAHSAIDIPTAKNNALASCGRYSNQCEIMYTNCSYAVPR